MALASVFRAKAQTSSLFYPLTEVNGKGYNLNIQLFR